MLNKYKYPKNKKASEKSSEAFFSADNRTRTYTPCGTRS